MGVKARACSSAPLAAPVQHLLLDVALYSVPYPRLPSSEIGDNFANKGGCASRNNFEAKRHAFPPHGAFTCSNDAYPIGTRSQIIAPGQIELESNSLYPYWLRRWMSKAAA